MSCKGRRVRPVRRRSACVRPRLQGARIGTRTADDRCKQVSGGVNLRDSGGLADLSLKPPRRWKATYWTLAIFLSLIVSTIASSQEENWFPVNNPRSREILAQDKKVSLSRTSMESQGPVESQGSLESKTDESRELPTESVWGAAYYETTTSDRPAELADDLRSRYERSPGGSHQGTKPSNGSRRNRQRGARKSNRGNQGCHINSLRVKVGDLGLGYKSDEIVLFKYCSGNCPRSRSNYDLTLSKLLKQNGILSGSNAKVISHSCCRPSKYEDVTFLDVQNQWQRVKRLSAAECMCMG
ncbi:glial cell line-derived neurotrophic factor-like [Heptranchias perlo]|uniref:glial cell line-derived neurotrophic factor-like n=1 Tax=Heptranchias perlo TaxID=212740 RepID=UPI003559CE61